MYAITATVNRMTIDGRTSTRQVATFYLDESVQDIVSAEEAERIAYDIIDPFGEYEYEVVASAVQVEAPVSQERSVKARLLLMDWIGAEVRVIGETSDHLTDDYASLVEEAKERALAIGVAWDRDLVPAYVWGYLSDVEQS